MRDKFKALSVVAALVFYFFCFNLTLYNGNMIIVYMMVAPLLIAAFYLLYKDILNGITSKDDEEN